MLDKGRATLAAKNGEYHYNCPLDQHILNFLGLDPEGLKAELATGKGDGEILLWISANSKHKRSAWEIAYWSDYQEKRGPDSDAETMSFFLRIRAQAHQNSRRHQNVDGRAGIGRPFKFRR